MSHGRLAKQGNTWHLHGAEGPTRADILAYYLKVAPRIIPFLQGRPVSTIWMPDDATREFRFRPIAPAACAGRFPTYRMAGWPGSYVAVFDRAILATLVGHGCLSFHPWNSTVVAAQRPNQMVFNLDREAIAFREVRNAALLLRELLAAYGLRAWVKTSGGGGLHVLVPLAGGAAFDDVAVVAETIVRSAIRREPALFSRDQRAGRRRGRILLDISRNHPGATLIAPYAVATSGLVSALLEWHELERPLYPDDFDMMRVVARARTDARNLAAFFQAQQSLEPLERCKRSHRTIVEVHPCVDGHTQWLVGDMGAVREARSLRAQSKRIRAEAEVTRIESANLRSHSQKLREAGGGSVVWTRN